MVLNNNEPVGSTECTRRYKKKISDNRTNKLRHYITMHYIRDAVTAQTLYVISPELSME